MNIMVQWGKTKLTTEPWANSFQLCFLMLWEWDWKSREGLLEEVAFDWEWKLVLNSIKDQSISDRWSGLCLLSQMGHICCKILRKMFREERIWWNTKARAKDNFGSYQIYFKTNRKPLNYLKQVLEGRWVAIHFDYEQPFSL